VPAAWTAGRKTGNASACAPCARPPRSGRGDRPGPARRVQHARRGPKPQAKRRPRPRRALRPAGPGAGLSWCLDPPVYRAPSRAVGGNAGRVSFSRPEGRSPRCPVSLAGAIAPATAPRRDQDQPGAKAPGQRPTRPRRALRPRRVGRWPLSFPDLPLYGAPSRTGGETRVAFPVPARTGEGTFTAAMAGAIAPATALRWHQDQPGAKAPGQLPSRPRRALRPRRVGRWPALLPDLPVYRAPPRRGGGETRVAFPDPARRSHPLPWTGKSVPAAHAVAVLVQHP